MNIAQCYSPETYRPVPTEPLPVERGPLYPPRLCEASKLPRTVEQRAVRESPPIARKVASLRRSILDLLAVKPLTVRELALSMHVASNRVSARLSVMLESGEIKRQDSIYSIDDTGNKR
jgi:hypothetical protein